LQLHWNRFGPRTGGFAVLALCACLVAPAGGEEPSAKPAAPPPVELDRLLKLPAPVEAPRERVGSATKGEWRSRFISARLERDAAQTALEAAQKQLGEAAGDTDSWQIAPPGAPTAGASDAPVSFQLRQEVRRQREELARCERHLQDLTIEADLAGVPASWRE